MDFESGFESVLRFLAITALVFAIGIPLRIYFRKRALKKYPELPELQKIKGEIRSLRNNGSTYNEIISDIRESNKFSKFIIQSFIIDVENEEKADLQNPIKSTKSHVSFEYPQNWKIKPLDQKLDAEKFFNVERSYSGIVSSSIFNKDASDVPSIDELNDILALQYQHYQMKENISKFGHFMGKGNAFTAKIINNTLSGRVFRYLNNNSGFYITLAYMDDDYSNVSDGLKMIEESLNHTM